MANVNVVGVAKHYGTAQNPVVAMADVTLHVESGEFVAVVGASGCGKSTLLRILAGFETATVGTVEVGGEAVSGPSPDRGVVFQDYGLFPWLTARENIAFGPKQRGLGRAAAHELSERFLATVGLTKVADKFPGELSGGMQQRVAIARVLANDPALLLMDEPFGALDALTRSDLQIELRRIHRATKTTVLFVTHSIEEAVFLADRIVVMTGGASHGVPGHIRSIVTVELPGNRDVTSAAFNEIKRHIANMVHEGADYA
jgi:NitT/TauT family transport system ATP-binding protein